MHYRLRTLMIASALGCVLAKSGCMHRVDVTEHYDSMSFTREQGESTFHEFSTGGVDMKYYPDGKRPPVAPIFVRLKNGTVVFLPEITKKQAQEFVRGWDLNPEADDWYSNNGNMCRFEEGRVVGFATGDSDTLTISNSKDGPFYTFPISAKDVRRMFGKPKKVTKFTWPHY